MAWTSGIKRAREDDQAALPVAAWRREGSPAAPTPDTSRVPTKTEARRFVKAVQREFEFAGKPPSMYKDFLAILGEFKRGSLGIDGVINRMQVILQGHPYVIRWFNKFLPSGYHLIDLQALRASAKPSCMLSIPWFHAPRK